MPDGISKTFNFVIMGKSILKRLFAISPYYYIMFDRLLHEISNIKYSLFHTELLEALFAVLSGIATLLLRALAKKIKKRIKKSKENARKANDN
jgi:membrane protein implicated in regulation of membrane protease activity